MFRHDVALSGDYLVVGDPFLDSDTRGAFAVWKRSTNVWSRVTYAAAAPNRGFAVAVSDSFVVIGDNA
ncbi:MAG: hypothetical protein ACOCSK_01265 [Rhodothermales bacterium]